MDSTDGMNGSRTALRQPFVETANALAGLYKQAVTAEREARDAGSRAAYMRIMQWAARKSRNADRITPADILNFCAAELAELSRHSSNQTLVERPSAQTQHPTSKHAHPDVKDKPETDTAQNPQSQPPSQTQHPQPQAPPVAYVPRDDPLVSDIKKLNVNPRKRQRIDISDTFVSACRDNDSLIFASDNGYAIRSPDSSMNPMFLEADRPARQPSAPSPRRETRDSRETSFISAPPIEYSGRKGKNPKAHIYDKLRRK